jgi:hypothetical protein
MKKVIGSSLLVILFLGVGIVVFPIYTDAAPVETKPTATILTKSTTTAQTKATATVQSKATATVQSKATATVQSKATATVVTKSAATVLTKSRYTNKECVKCHPDRVNDIKTSGGKHRSVPCVGCHFGHPPEVKKPISLCSKCHGKERRSHFAITGCLNCHRNPHTPLTITLKGKDACLDCHVLEQEQIMRNKSKHTALDCSACHDVHRKVPQCSQCHTPHSGKISGGCKLCHNAHMPKATYTADFPSKDCGACHKMVTDLMKATASKHKPLDCAFCHRDKHIMIPTCQECHGSQHPAGILAKFPKCVKCHNSPHDLNNWPAAETKDVSGNAPKKQTSERPAR